ncbi:hypothetical protein FA202_04745 [Pseudomonas aeruginosa]|nr:hypothetical protein [Pseudomonas aeruginosa]
MQTVMMPSARCGTVPMQCTNLLAAQPSHSDDFSNAPERICLDTSNCSLSRLDDDLMAIR